MPERSRKKSARRAQTRIEINREYCKGCGICVAFCPKQVLEIDEKEKAVAQRPEDCNACAACELRCPDIAIELLTSEDGRDE